MLQLSTYRKGCSPSHGEYNMVSFRGPFDMAEMHKIVGYGLQRISPSTISFDGFLGFEDRFDLNGFIKFLKERDINTHCIEDREVDLKSCIHYTSKTLIVIPPQFATQWHRCGDILDRTNSETSRDLTVLRHGIPGYRYLENQQNHQKIGMTMANLFFDMYDKWLFERSEAVKMGLEGPLNDLAYNMGFGTINAAVCDTKPYVPDIVRHFCSYLQIFKDDKTIEELEPLMCVYWR